MTVRMTFMAYKPEALATNIQNNDSREEAAKLAIESAGGTFLGFYGLVGQDHHVVVISDFEDATDYMSVVGKVMMGGATSDIKTVTCYTGAEAKIAMAKATGNDINYTPPS